MRRTKVPSRVKPGAQPPDPEVLRFAQRGHEIIAYRWARPGAPRLLLVHGIGMGHSVYTRFVETARHECEVVCVDLPGFGDSPEPTEALSIEGTADLLAECIRDLDLAPLVAVGHSMGSQVVAELAARHPRLATHLVLVAPTVTAFERTAARQTARMLQDFTNGSPIVFVKGLTAYLRTGPRWFVRKLGPTLAHRIEDRLPQIAQPTLILRGSRDPVSPRVWAEDLVALLPDAELRELSGRGHEALISSGNPAARTVLDWLADHGEPTADPASPRPE